MKADHLETKLIHVFESQRRESITERRPPRGKFESLVTRKVQDSSRAANEVHL